MFGVSFSKGNRFFFLPVSLSSEALQAAKELREWGNGVSKVKIDFSN